MSDLISAAKEKVILYWLVAFYFTLFSAVSWGISWMTATAGVNFSELEHDARVRVWTSCFNNWGLTILALINTSIVKVKKGQLPIGNDDDDGTLLASRTVKKTQITSESVTEKPDTTKTNQNT